MSPATIVIIVVALAVLAAVVVLVLDRTHRPRRRSVHPHGPPGSGGSSR